MESIGHLCKICNKKYKSYQSLWKHNKKFHNTLNPQPTQINSNNYSNNYSNNPQPKKKIYSCSFCNKILSRIDNLKRHEKSCKDTNKQNIEIQLQLTQKENEILKLKLKKSERIDNNYKLETKLNLPINNHLIDIIVNKSKTIEELKNENTELKENNITNNLIVPNSMSSTLMLNEVIIVSRTEDNYINATQLCQAGNKQFNDWFRLTTTKQLINEAESETIN